MRSPSDIAADESAVDELAKLDVYSTPATLIDGELVVGFNRKRLAQLLGIQE
ncbi:MAG TPA: NrdH-redoxin [Anaerolineae bacterium]|nr:NrdH-redoxin [Anaerolineae bacterium]